MYQIGKWNLGWSEQNKAAQPLLIIDLCLLRINFCMAEHPEWLEPQGKADLMIRYVSEITEEPERDIYQINITARGGRRGS